MKRRDFMRLGCATVIGAGTGTLRSSLPGALSLGHPFYLFPRPTAAATLDAASTLDFTLRIAPMMVELAPHVVISTLPRSCSATLKVTSLRAEGGRLGVPP